MPVKLFDHQPAAMMVSSKVTNCLIYCKSPSGIQTEINVVDQKRNNLLRLYSREKYLFAKKNLEHDAVAATRQRDDILW